MNVLPPPAIYDHHPKGMLTWVLMPPDMVAKACNTLAMACAVRLDSKHCLVIINKDYVSQLRELLRHERAHCNGWHHAS